MKNGTMTYACRNSSGTPQLEILLFFFRRHEGACTVQRAKQANWSTQRQSTTCALRAETVFCEIGTFSDEDWTRFSAGETGELATIGISTNNHAVRC